MICASFQMRLNRLSGRRCTSPSLGGKHLDAKPLKGFKGASVLEVVENFDGNTYRAVYTVRFAGAVYALHVFQKKSKKGIKTPEPDINLVKSRLKNAEKHYRRTTGGKP